MVKLKNKKQIPKLHKWIGVLAIFIIGLIFFVENISVKIIIFILAILIIIFNASGRDNN